MPTATARKPAVKQSTSVTITLPALAKGEHYAGIILVDGKPSHHLILLPGENKKTQWQAAIEWAQKQGGELPTRKEQALLFANVAQEFQSACYWSSEQHASLESYAWLQNFTTGSQGCSLKGNDYRARAVRRLKI